MYLHKIYITTQYNTTVQRSKKSKKVYTRRNELWIVNTTKCTRLNNMREDWAVCWRLYSRLWCSCGGAERVEAAQQPPSNQDPDEGHSTEPAEERLTHQCCCSALNTLLFQQADDLYLCWMINLPLDYLLLLSGKSCQYHLWLILLRKHLQTAFQANICRFMQKEASVHSTYSISQTFATFLT